MCKECKKVSLYKWRKKNPEAYKRHYSVARVKYKYGLTTKDVLDLRTKQNNTCPICIRVREKFVIDHCHKTGVVRGLLCHNCNTLLGHVENELKMERIKRYLNAGMEDNPSK